MNGNLYWDLFGLYNSIRNGISYYAKDSEVESVAVDSWGASYGFLDEKGRLLEPIYHYRDLRTEYTMKRMYEILPKRQLFEMTGCQPARSYTPPQLYSYVERHERIIDLADKMLFLPDLLEYFLPEKLLRNAPLQERQVFCGLTSRIGHMRCLTFSESRKEC